MEKTKNQHYVQRMYIKRDSDIFPSIKESKFYHDAQLTEHTLSRLEGAYKELLDSIEANTEIIYEDKSRARFIGYNDKELDFVISDNPAKTVWCHFNEICIPISKHIAIVMRVKDDKAPMISREKDNIIDMSLKGFIAYNTM